MALEVWYKNDIARILTSTQIAMVAALRTNPPLDPERAEAYLRGVADAIGAVAAAFGLTAAAAVPMLPVTDDRKWAYAADWLAARMDVVDVSIPKTAVR